MAQFFQITANEILSGISKAIYDVFGDSLSIYKDKQEYLELPAVTIYCINYNKVTERYDRFVNTFDVIINYFPGDSVIIDNRIEMYNQAEKIMDAIKYINLPAYTKNDKDELVETLLPNACREYSLEEKEEFMQISGTYVVRTRKYEDTIKMAQLDLDITNK